MEIVASKRIDHLGIIAGTIKDLRLIEQIDEILPTDSRSKVSSGEAVAAMLINSLGFSNRPLSLTPQFFESKALDALFRDNVEAEDFNRHKLGRTLDDIHSYGCECFFSLLSKEICKQERVDPTFSSLDSTTFSVTGK